MCRFRCLTRCCRSTWRACPSASSSSGSTAPPTLCSSVRSWLSCSSHSCALHWCVLLLHQALHLKVLHAHWWTARRHSQPVCRKHPQAQGMVPACMHSSMYMIMARSQQARLSCGAAPEYDRVCNHGFAPELAQHEVLDCLESQSGSLCEHLQVQGLLPNIFAMLTSREEPAVCIQEVLWWTLACACHQMEN